MYRSRNNKMLDLIKEPIYLLLMSKEYLFTHQPGVDLRKEKALRMISEGHSYAEVRLQLEISQKTLDNWIKSGLPAGDPDLDQLSLVDGLSERERQG